MLHHFSKTVFSPSVKVGQDLQLLEPDHVNPSFSKSGDHVRICRSLVRPFGNGPICVRAPWRPVEFGEQHEGGRDGAMDSGVVFGWSEAQTGTC